MALNSTNAPPERRRTEASHSARGEAGLSMDSHAPRQTDESSTGSAPSIDDASHGAQSPVTIGGVWSRLGPARWLGILWATAPAICGITLLAFLGTLSGWLLMHSEFGLAAYVALFAISAGLGLLPTYAQSILGGWVFGFWTGWSAAMFAFTTASIIGYVIARTVSRDRIERLVKSNPKSRTVREALVGRGFWQTLGIVSLIRVPPNSPFALTNLAMASIGVRVLPYTLGTLMGMAPRTAIVVWAASEAERTGARDIQEFVREGPGLAVALGGLAVMIVVLGVLGSIANHALARMTSRSAAEPNCSSRDKK